MNCERCPDEDTPKCYLCQIKYIEINCRGHCDGCNQELKEMCEQVKKEIMQRSGDY